MGRIATTCIQYYGGQSQKVALAGTTTGEIAAKWKCKAGGCVGIQEIGGKEREEGCWEMGSPGLGLIYCEGNDGEESLKEVGTPEMRTYLMDRQSPSHAAQPVCDPPSRYALTLDLVPYRHKCFRESRPPRRHRSSPPPTPYSKTRTSMKERRWETAGKGREVACVIARY